jgi:5'-3' exoribonuclease 1
MRKQIGCFGFFLGENESGLYGCHIEVEGHFRKRLNLRVMQTYHVSAYSAEMLKRYRDESVYYNLPSVAKKLGVSPMSLSRITSNVYVVSDSGTKMDIGLHLKFESRQQKVIGYTRRSDRGWELSKQAVDLIREYHESFPTILPYLNKPGGDDVNSVDIFGADSDSELKRLQSWLSAKNIKTFIQVALDVEMFPGNIVAELERFVDSIMKPEAEPETRTLSDIPAQFVLLPAQASYRLTVRQKFALGDRVVFIPDSGASGVLISGAAGTVIGIEKTQPRKMHPRPQQHQSGKQFRGKSSEVVSDYWVHLLLDERTVGASTLDGICSPGRGITVRSTCLLNLTNPQPPVYRRLTDEPMQSINQSESPSSTGAKGQNVKILQNNSFKTRQNVWTKRDNQRQMLNTLKATSIQKQDTSLLRSDPPSISKNELAFQLKSILNIDDGTTISASPLIPAEESPPKTSSAAVKVPSWLLGTLPTSVIAARSLSSKQQQ